VLLFLQVNAWNDLFLDRILTARTAVCTCLEVCTCGAIHRVPPVCEPAIPDRITQVQTSWSLAQHTEMMAAVRFLAPDKDFDTLPCVATGVRVMLLRNISPERCLMNGVMGTVTAIRFKANGTNQDSRQPDRISVQFDGAGQPVHIYRTVTQSLLLGGSIYKKTTFPLAPCYAMTGHKAQGATFVGQVIIDIQEAFAPGLTYTMLTRATDRALLKIVNSLSLDMLQNAMPDPVHVPLWN
jgi:hypothetical protein